MIAPVAKSENDMNGPAGDGQPDQLLRNTHRITHAPPLLTTPTVTVATGYDLENTPNRYPTSRDA